MPDGTRIQDRNIDSIPSTQRNPVLADVFHRLGYMERQGSGLNKIAGAYKNAANFRAGMEPTFYSDQVEFTVILKNLNYINKGSLNEALKGSLNETEKRVLMMISRNPRITQNKLKVQMETS